MDKSLGRFRFKWVDIGDKDELLALFHSAFGCEMSQELWKWKYKELGIHGVMGVDEQGSPISYYGGIPRNFSSRECDYKGVQISDVMVEPSKRGLMTKNGVFFLSASEFLGEMTGEGKAYDFAFGFPMERAGRLGEKLGLYAKVDEIKRVEWSIRGNLLRDIVTKTKELLQDELDAVDVAWSKMKASLKDAVIPIKDSEFVRYRYFEHPTNKYRVIGLSNRFGGGEIGIIMLREHDDGSVELSDMICEKQNIVKAVEGAASVAKKMGGDRLFGWFTPTIVASLPKYDSIADECSVTIATAKLKELSDTLRGRLWLMGGDTDFR